MEPSVVPMVEIALDRVRHLRFDLNALIAAEKATGLNLLRKPDLSAMNIETIRGLIWAGLVHEDPDLTAEQVGRSIGMANLGNVVGKFQEAFGLAMPAPTGERGDDGNPLPGSSSGPLDATTSASAMPSSGD